MSRLVLTCDRKDGFVRTALWKDGIICDLYVENENKPDLTGALVDAKVVRVSEQNRAAWLDGGLEETIYIDRPKNISPGDLLRVAIISMPVHEKAFEGIIIGKGEGKGIVKNPPLPWQRAFMETKEGKISSIIFSNREDYQQCKAWLENEHPGFTVDLKLSKDEIFPELDDIMEMLDQPVVALPGGGDIVIEKTEALTAIDVNGGSSFNALQTNLNAMKEISRQIRLRNITGIIVIDALKMKNRKEKEKVLETFAKLVKRDPAEISVFGFSKLGLMELTRRKTITASDCKS